MACRALGSRRILSLAAPILNERITSVFASGLVARSLIIRSNWSKSWRAKASSRSVVATVWWPKPSRARLRFTRLPSSSSTIRIRQAVGSLVIADPGRGRRDYLWLLDKNTNLRRKALQNISKGRAADEENVKGSGAKNL